MKDEKTSAKDLIFNLQSKIEMFSDIYKLSAKINTNVNGTVSSEVTFNLTKNIILF